MKKIVYLLILLIGFTVCPGYIVNAQQGVAVNSSGLPADNSAGLDVDFPDRGALLPRMTASQRDAIANPATGLTIYNTDCNVYNYNAGTPSSPNWTTLSSSNSITAGVTISSNPSGAICSSATFTATPASGITSATYDWQVNGSSVGSGTTFTSSSLNNGDIVTCVLSTSQACVSGSPATSNAIAVTVTPTPATPGSISGNSPLICITGTSTGNVYSISPVAGATTYNWMVPPYATITDGFGSTSITVTFGPSQGNGNISVSASNECGTSAASSITTNVGFATLGTPGSITGSTTVFNNAVGKSYYIAPVTGASTYNWTVPSGAVVATGQGTDSITVNFSTNAGYVSVTAVNACNTSSASTQYVTTCSAGHGSQSFSYNGSYQTWSVPCTDTVKIQCWGAGASNGNGIGGFAQGTLQVTPGQTLYVYVGGNGSGGGFNGGGYGYNSSYYGGGMTDVRVGGTSISNWVIVAGGSGGYGGGGYAGGAGGNSYTSAGSYCNSVNTYGGQGYGGGYGSSPFGGSITNGGCDGGNGNYFCCSSSYSGGGGGGGLNSGGTGGYDGSYNSVNSNETGTRGQGGSYGGNYPGCGNAPGGGGGFYGGGGSQPGNCTTGAGGGGSSWVSPLLTNVSFYGYSQSGQCYFNGSNLASNGYNGYVIMTW